MSKVVGALPRPWGVAKSVRANPNPTLRLWVVAKPVGHGQGRGGVAKAVETLPSPWGRGQGLEGVANPFGAWPRP